MTLLGTAVIAALAVLIAFFLVMWARLVFDWMLVCLALIGGVDLFV